MTTLTRRALVVGLAALALAACVKQLDPIEAGIQSVRERTVPAKGRLLSGYPPSRRGQVLRASWEIETEMEWDAYAAWVKGQSPDFKAASSEPGALRFSRPLEGDVYSVTLKPQPLGGSLLIEATFEASPF